MSRTALLLLAIGLAQIAAEAASLPAARGIAAAACASPAPRVFTSARGLETFSTRFDLEWTDRAGRARSLEITPEVYARLHGPYNRRNVYGAALAFGPVLATDARTRPLFEAVARRSLAGEAPLLVELGVDPRDVAGSVRVRWTPREGTAIGLPRAVEVDRASGEVRVVGPVRAAAESGRALEGERTNVDGHPVGDERRP